MSLKNAKTLATLMDSQFNVLGLKFGLDPVINLIPGLGTVIGLILSLYILKIGYDMNLPQDKLSQMIGNVIIDFVIGAIPGVGTIGDIFYKSNLKNIDIIEKHLSGKEKAEEGEIVGDSKDIIT